METNTMNCNFKSNIGNNVTEHDYCERPAPHFQEEDVIEYPATPNIALSSAKKIENVSEKSCRAVTLSCYVISVTAILYVMEKLIARDEFWHSAATFLHMLNCTHEK